MLMVMALIKANWEEGGRGGGAERGIPCLNVKNMPYMSKMSKKKLNFQKENMQRKCFGLFLRFVF